MERKVWNLYNDKTISSMKSVFNIHSHQDIEEFWLFYQENCTISDDEITHLIIKYLFDYTSKFLQKVDSYDIIIEYSNEMKYITFWHQNHTEMLKEAYVDLKNYPRFNLKISDEKCTFQIIRNNHIIEEEKAPLIPIVETPQIFQSTPKTLQVYDFISNDDLVSMQEINDELLNQMFYISSSQIDEDKLATIINELDSYIAIFAKYDELQEISSEICSFRDILEDNTQNVIANTNAELNLFFEGIISNLKNWTDRSFIKGIEDLNYYNASINSDISMIKQFLNIGEVTNQQDEDDIFF